MSNVAGPPVAGADDAIRGDHDPTCLREELLHNIFEAVADGKPDRPAVAFPGNDSWTYRELEARANQIACWFSARGAGRGDFIALWLPRSPDVYAAMLGIMKCGAAYVPLDPEYPAERVRQILEDSGATWLLTCTELAATLSPATAATALLDQLAPELAALPPRRLDRGKAHPTPDDTAYVIYTSGSTGRPKGVPITHRSACNLVRAEQKIFAVRPEDRIFQGFSVAFDASVEEIWLAFASGAVLVPATAECIRAGPALADHLRQTRITVLSCVPTLLELVQDPPPAIRLLILGGEVCPPKLVQRWWLADGSRRIVNTYGPTEATVIATYADCTPSEPVTIGRPLPNYRCHVLDASLQPVAGGTPGELCISGVGLSPGYLHRPELTAEKFVLNPFGHASNGTPLPPHEALHKRLYRSGDLVRMNARGNLEFLGRIDAQVKLRGFRIELAEIEAAMRECDPAVISAAVMLREDVPGVQQLAGYVVRLPAEEFREESLKTLLRRRLPAYMVPATIDALPRLPMLPSGKLDRKNLPLPQCRAVSESVADPPQSPLERKIAAAWLSCGGSDSAGNISRSADFFLDLGGHSLLAARMVSELRRDADFRDLAVRDVYQHPTIERLAAVVAARCARENHQPAAAPASRKPAPEKTPPRKWRYRLFCLVQALAIYPVVGFYSLQWLTPYLVYVWMIENDETRIMAIIWALTALLGFFPLMVAGTIAAKWILVGRMKAGTYPMWGFFHLRFWLMHRILDAIAVEYLEGTPLMGFYFRLMGAKIGRNVHFRSYNIGAFDLVSVGDDTSLGDATALMAYTMEEGVLRLGPVTIGKRCHVGAGSVLRPGTVMEDDCRLMHMSLLPEGSRIPSGETWFGSPAQRMDSTQAPPVVAPRPGMLRRFWFGALQAIGIFVLPVTYLAALLPGLVLLNELAVQYGEIWSLLAAPLVAVAFVILLCTEILVVKWLLLGRIKPGDYPVQSWFFVRKWFVDQLMALSLDILGPMYATLYLNPWYRLLGAKMGKRAEISTACAASPDLLEIGDESFIADAVLLGVPEVEAGRLLLRKTRIGRRAFVGNSALLPAGAVVADHSLIGVLSAPPLSAPGAAEPGMSWLGSPAIRLPSRQQVHGFSETDTFRPTRTLVFQRLIIEFFRITLPLTMFVVLTSLLITTSVALDPYLTMGQQIALFPVLYFLAGMGAAVLVILAKWLLIGRYKEATRPLWCTFVWRSELVNALHEALAGAYLMDMLAGTPLFNWFYRALGMKIGRRVYLDSGEFTEFDLISIGDDAVLNMEATIQTHLFEDRVMKMSRVKIGSNCSIGACSVVLYDTELGNESVLEELSLVMKGESLPPETRWHGSPARRADAAVPTEPLAMREPPAASVPAVAAGELVEVLLG